METSRPTPPRTTGARKLLSGDGTRSMAVASLRRVRARGEG